MKSVLLQDSVPIDTFCISVYRDSKSMTVRAYGHRFTSKPRGMRLRALTFNVIDGKIVVKRLYRK